MITISNENLAVVCDESAHGLSVVDARRGVRWSLDEQTLVWGNSADLSQRQPLVPLRASSTGHEALTLTYRAGGTELQIIYTLHDTHVEVRFPPPPANDLQFTALPGSFVPDEPQHRLLLPIMQGMLWDGRGPAFDMVRAEGSHFGFSMAFLGTLTSRGGLLVTAETRDDLRWWMGKDAAGRSWTTPIQIASLGTMRYERVARIIMTDPDIVAIAKAYRARVQERGRFISWEEKLEERPGLAHLFGALMTFVGYCQDDIDYAAACRKLRAYGFDRALIYPVRFNAYGSDIQMGGRPAINLDAGTIAAIKDLDYDVAPWSWLNEAQDNGSPRIREMFRTTAQGERPEGWAIDAQRWHPVCSSLIADYQQGALKSTVADLTWDHFDVLACAPVSECFATDHPPHRGRPLSRTEDRAAIRRTFLADQTTGLVVSSENFNDAYSLEYDLGSVKAWPQYGPWPFWPVPLTMLVYHDSMIHSWWEVHNYNSHWFGRTKATSPFFEYGGGRPRLMAALDALMGCPPDVFPFGAQYGWTGRGTETFLYRYRFQDPEVQIALREALPVAKLHRRIGQCEMVHFKILSDDGYVQESAFSDGTRVVANFSRDVIGGTRGIGHVVMEGVDCLTPQSWRVVD
ncbi:MAG: glycoside hydrolase [Anaerolineae bacterium]|nr:glycoside hydrolase [Anaerolineae bacterium]